MTQTLYAHMNKRNLKKKKEIVFLSVCVSIPEKYPGVEEDQVLTTDQSLHLLQ
jgi:hypothetical protein